jgi:hypothetical protein
MENTMNTEHDACRKLEEVLVCQHRQASKARPRPVFRPMLNKPKVAAATVRENYERFGF